MEENNFSDTLLPIYTQPLPLVLMKKIWIGKFKKANVPGFSFCIEVDDLVCIENGKLIDCLDLPTHVVTECKGSLSDVDFEVTVKDLKTEELSTIKLT